jgi:hypothetical protein
MVCPVFLVLLDVYVEVINMSVSIHLKVTIEHPYIIIATTITAHYLNKLLLLNSVEELRVSVQVAGGQTAR